jgi:hypothetical protein
MKDTEVIPEMTEPLEIIQAAGWALKFGQIEIINNNTGEYISRWYAVHPHSGQLHMFFANEGDLKLSQEPEWAADTWLDKLINYSKNQEDWRF